MFNAAENPLIPMGAVTGRPSREKIHAFLRAFREAGFTQFLIYPRSGCELEYMSAEWFDTCGIILDECREQGFSSVWLYDEFNWPSGQCGGRLMQENPEYSLKYLRVSEKDGHYSFDIFSNPKAPDVLDPEAMRKFIECTHERYAEHFGKDFGSLIKGIFTDEPAFAYIGGEPADGPKADIAYYPGLEEDYEKMTGSSLRNDLVFCLRNRCAPFWKPFADQLLGKRFLDSFVRPIRSWCDSHGLLMTGHLLSEDTLRGSFNASGTPMAVTDTFSLPAVDEIGTQMAIHSIEWLTLGTAEHAVRKNGNGGLAELFALGPCDMSLAEIRRQIRLFAMFGIDHYLLAVSPFDMRGNAIKTQYFNPFSPAQPYFPAFAALKSDAAAAAAIAGKGYIPEIQIRRPGTEAQLIELLIQLVKNQRQWSLIGENEEGSAPVVLRLEQEGISTEKMPDGSYHRRSSFSSFLNALDEISPLKTAVREPDGSLAQDIFVRTYTDGSCQVINFSSSREPRRLCLCRNGGEAVFELPPDGTSFFCGWRVQLDRPNLKRLPFEKGLCRIRLDSELENLVLLLRQCDAPVVLELDGHPVEASGSTTALPEGFRELYKETAPLRLEAGEHVLEMKGDFPEYPYLPSAFLAGAFADFGSRIAEYKDDGAGLENYIGKLIQTGMVEIPCGASTLQFEADGLFTELFLDGEKMPERLHAPYIWRIPEHLAGKTVEVRIERSTSCGPMFGTERFAQLRPGDNPRWLQPYSPRGKVRHPAVEISFQ
jgi:hypothetical protein